MPPREVLHQPTRKYFLPVSPQQGSQIRSAEVTTQHKLRKQPQESSRGNFGSLNRQMLKELMSILKAHISYSIDYYHTSSSIHELPSPHWDTHKSPEIFNPNKCSASYKRPAIRKSEVYFHLHGTNYESMLTKILIAVATFLPTDPRRQRRRTSVDWWWQAWRSTRRRQRRHRTLAQQDADATRE